MNIGHWMSFFQHQYQIRALLLTSIGQLHESIENLETLSWLSEAAGRSCQVLSFPAALKARGKSELIKPAQCPPSLHVGTNHVKRTNKRRKHRCFSWPLDVKQPLTSEEWFSKYNTQWGIKGIFFFYLIVEKEIDLQRGGVQLTAEKSNKALIQHLNTEQ